MSASRPNTRQRIVEGALSLFARAGYLNTSIDQVANLVQVRKANIFYYFASREALGLEVVQHAEARVLRNIAEAREAGRDVVTDLFDGLDDETTRYCCWLRLVGQGNFIEGEVGRRLRESVVRVHEALSRSMDADDAWGVVSTALSMSGLPDQSWRPLIRSWFLARA